MKEESWLSSRSRSNAARLSDEACTCPGRGRGVVVGAMAHSVRDPGDGSWNQTEGLSRWPAIRERMGTWPP